MFIKSLSIRGDLVQRIVEFTNAKSLIRGNDGNLHTRSCKLVSFVIFLNKGKTTRRDRSFPTNAVISWNFSTYRKCTKEARIFKSTNNNFLSGPKKQTRVILYKL